MANTPVKPLVHLKGVDNNGVELTPEKMATMTTTEYLGEEFGAFYTRFCHKTHKIVSSGQLADIVAPLQFGTACIYAARWSMMGVDVTIRDGCDGSLDRWLCEMLQIKWQPGIAKENCLELDHIKTALRKLTEDPSKVPALAHWDQAILQQLGWYDEKGSLQVPMRETETDVKTSVDVSGVEEGVALSQQEKLQATSRDISDMAKRGGTKSTPKEKRKFAEYIEM